MVVQDKVMHGCEGLSRVRIEPLPFDAAGVDVNGFQERGHILLLLQGHILVYKVHDGLHLIICFD